MKTVKEILEAYNDNYLSKYDFRFGKKFPSEKEIPAVIVLKRKAIRVYPDSQKIALYYSSQLDKYVSIPYGPGTQSSIQISESKGVQFDPEVTDAEKEEFKKIYDKSKKITSKDIRKKLPIGTVVRVQGARKAAKEAISRGLEHGDIPYTLGNLTGIAGVAAAKGVAKGVGAAYRGIKKLVKKEEADATKRFKSKLKDIREEKQQLDELVPLAVGALTAARIAAPHVARFVARNVPKVASAARSVGSKAKDLTKKLIQKVKTKKAEKAVKKGKGKGKTDKIGAFAGGMAAKDVLDSLTDSGSGGGGGGEESAAQAARRIGKEASTPSTQAQFAAPGSFLATNRFGGNQDVYSDPRYQFGQRRATASPVRESTNFEKIKLIADNNIKTDDIFFGDNSITINNRIAKKLINVYESLNKDNKKKVEEMINEDVNSFKKLINFAIRQ